MLLLKIDVGSSTIALITEGTTSDIQTGVASAAFEQMRFVATAAGRHAFLDLLGKALDDEGVASIAVSHNARCVFDDELPARLEQACERAAGNSDWAVLASTGMSANGTAASVAYASMNPRMFSMSIPVPIVDCGVDLYVINAAYLRDRQSDWRTLSMPPESFAHWCILDGYLQGRISAFRPELAIGVDGDECKRDLTKHAAMLATAFKDRFSDNTVPSLMGAIELSSPQDTVDRDDADQGSERERALSRPMVSLREYVRRAVMPACTKMSLSVITRTQFSRDHLLGRMLSTLTRARQDLDIELEVVLSTDLNAREAREHHSRIQLDFPELKLVLQINKGNYAHSRVDNLIGGIMAAQNDYVVIIDDDDYVDLDALKSISSARFLGQDPVLFMSSQVRNETWEENSAKRWYLKRSEPGNTYFSHNVYSMFKGSNQLPVCSIVAPRIWMQKHLRDVPLRHDLSEDYTIYLAMLSAPDLPQFLIYEDVFCVISSRDDGSNTITMNDRRPWTRDITLFLHDVFVGAQVSGRGTVQMLSQIAHISPTEALHGFETHQDPEGTRQMREVSMLKTENDHLRELLNRDLGAQK